MFPLLWLVSVFVFVVFFNFAFFLDRSMKGCSWFSLQMAFYFFLTMSTPKSRQTGVWAKWFFTMTNLCRDLLLQDGQWKRRKKLPFSNLRQSFFLGRWLFQEGTANVWLEGLFWTEITTFGIYVWFYTLAPITYHLSSHVRYLNVNCSAEMVRQE